LASAVGAAWADSTDVADDAARPAVTENEHTPPNERCSGAGEHAESGSETPDSPRPRIRGTAEVTLRRIAVADPAGGVTLGEIASVAGSAGEAVALVELIDAATLADTDRPYVVIDRAFVEAAMREAGVRLGAVSLSGGRCVVRFGKRATLTPEQSANVGDERATSRTELAADVASETVRGEIVRQLVAAYGVEPAALRLRFPDAARQAGVLNDALGAGRLTVRRMTSTDAGRVIFEVTQFDDVGGVTARERIRVEPSVKRRVLRAAERLTHGDAVRAEAVRTDAAWLSPGEKPVLDASLDVLGWEAASRLAAGEVIREGDLEPPVLIERGEKVRLFAHRGGFVIEAWVRAEEDGTMGEVVPCVMAGSDQPFFATVDGRGRVVMRLD
jgi:flagella basal body P-ring formation protein FlgA